MIAHLREAFNAKFSEEVYQAFTDAIAAEYGHRPPFRVAETPLFIPTYLRDRLVQACEDINDVIVRDDFKALSESALLPGQIVPNETPHTTFLQYDFGICKDEEGLLTPQLIEAQGFPSLYCFQDLLARTYRKFYDIPDGFTHLFNGLSSEDYLAHLREAIVGQHDPENVILLEIEPEKQTTAIDFYAARAMLGIEFVCISKLKKEGRSLYYFKGDRKIKVEKIYNRVIFDELEKRGDLAREFNLTDDDVDVEWAGHPNWFFRISKHTLPLLKSPYVPESFFLDQLEQLPDDLENYVLKPLYSFAGTGVIIHVTPQDIASVTDPANYILQRKVTYEPVIPTLDVPAKCEVRMMLLWERNALRPVLVNNLIRLSKGEMVGVRYNKDKTWVGGSVGFFEG